MSKKKRSMNMDSKQVADAFTAALKAGKGEETALWSDDVVSIEAMEGPMSVCRGRAAVMAKAEWWMANHEVHRFEAHGPYVNGDAFALRFVMEVTAKADGRRMAMEEVGLYTVRDGRIVEERFFY
jgi:ketosteroid isomerase-like protein